MAAHQVPPPLPGAALAELVAALINNGMAVAEMGPASTPIELEVVAWLCRKLGLPADAGGVLTSGGSLGNLTALLAMRQARAGFDAWRDGVHAGPPLAVIAGSDSHYSVARAVRVMGFGDGGAIAAPVDARHRHDRRCGRTRGRCGGRDRGASRDRCGRRGRGSTATRRVC